MKHTTFYALLTALIFSLLSSFALAQEQEKPDEPTFELEEVLGDESFWKIDTDKGEGRMSNRDVVLHFIKQDSQGDNPVYKQQLHFKGRQIGRNEDIKYKPYLKESNKDMYFDYSGHDTFSDNMKQLITLKEDQLVLQTERGDIIFMDKQDGEPEKPSCEERGLSELECLKHDNPQEYYKRLKEQNRKGADKFDKE